MRPSVERDSSVLRGWLAEEGFGAFAATHGAGLATTGAGQEPTSRPLHVRLGAVSFQRQREAGLG
jgi:hypothetical protein